MSPSHQPRDFCNTPSSAWLLCAACGPLAAEHAEQAGFSLPDEPGLRSTRRLYEVEEPLPFLELQRLVAADTDVQEALVQVEAACRRGGSRKRSLTHAEIAGRARAALLLGNSKAFMQHYREYVAGSEYGWHPDSEHMRFWDSVLGPGWAGMLAVPEGDAQDELQLIAASAFAFCAYPVERPLGAGTCGAPVGYDWLETAAALREADAGALGGLLAEDSAAAAAAAELLSGSLSSAQLAFENLLGRKWDKRFSIVQLNGLPLLIYALVAGVLAGGSRRHLKAWFDTARYALDYIYPPSMVQHQWEMASFLDSLEIVDDVVNRNSLFGGTLHINGVLACLPFAMRYTALPCYLRSTLNPNELAESVDALAHLHLPLLACYGAVGLLAAEGLSAEWQKRMQALAGSCRVSLPPQLSPPGARAREALLAAMQKDARRGSSLRQGEYALPPTLVASRMGGGVVIRMMDWREQEEYDDSATLRCMNKLASNGLLLLEGATPAEFTRLFAAMQVHVDVVGNLALPGELVEGTEPRAVLLLSCEEKGRFLAALRLRLLPDALPLMTPSCGLDVPVLERADGSTIAARRDCAAEWAAVEKAATALQQAGCVSAERLVQGVMECSGFAELAELLRACRECGLECCWEKGHALRLHQPQGGLSLRKGVGAEGWLELGADLPVDEGRVLELSTLLEAFGARCGNTLHLAKEEYLLLNPALERQLALLELVWQEKRGKRGVASAAIPLLEALNGADMPAAAASDSPEPATLPASLCATLRPYQAEGYRWLAERADMGLGALLADDMGLGKTVQLLALLLHVAEQPGAGAALVVAPVSLLGNWAEEAARFAPTLSVVTYDPRKEDCLSGLGAGTLVLASYGQIVSRQKEFAAMHWEVVVLDEAQNIKNPDSQRARAVCTLAARVRLCLTGTPIENSLLDLWSQMRFLNPGLLGSRAAFLRRFKKTQPAQFALLREVLAPIVLRRTKAEVLTQLPPLTETIEWVEFSKEERALYESLRRSAVEKLGGEQGAGTGGIGLLAELTRLRRACCHGKLAFAEYSGNSAKLTAMCGRVEELRAAGRRVLVFSQFTDVLDLAQEMLEGAGACCLRLDGSTPAVQRNEAVRGFQQGEADAFLISLKAGAAGLNLTAADYVMLLDPWWNPAAEAQAAGRSHRMGQQHPVTLCRFVVRGTVEERILAMHAEKKELAESLLSGSAESMSLANLKALLG